MAEALLDVRALPKETAYEQIEAHTYAVLDGIADTITAMATISALLYHGFGHLWVGFYRVVEPGRLLRVGPYQGSLGCLEILFDAGVCGTAAARERTVTVEDVAAFPGHITCDPRSRSEIVVPVFDARQRLIAVLDIDSEQEAKFDSIDARHLERLLGWFSRVERPPYIGGPPNGS